MEANSGFASNQHVAIIYSCYSCDLFTMYRECLPILLSLTITRSYCWYQCISSDTIDIRTHP